MKVKSIESMLSAMPEKEMWARERRRVEAKAVDDKLNARAGFRNELGLSQEEYKRQTERSKKMGFDAVLAKELEK